MYKVIYPFVENGKKFWSGDIYSNEDKKRIQKLATKNNKFNRVFIKEIKENIPVKEPIEPKKKVDGAPEINKSEGQTK